jgi:hypothetical protein
VDRFLASYRELSKLRGEMTESFTGDTASAETEGRAVEAVLDNGNGDRVTNNQAIEESSPTPKSARAKDKEPGSSLKRKATSRSKRRSKLSDQKTKPQLPHPAIKQRFGLPDGFVPRWQRYERSILLEQNIYRLPNGDEFVPAHPSGTLGSHQHLYALLSVEQYLDHRRGSVYVRNDGRIFDYSVDSNVPNGDLFDTGYTIYDLERTGRYAPTEKSGKRKREVAKYRKAANAG